MPDLPQIILPFPLETEAEERVRQVGQQLCDPVVRSLTAVDGALKEIA